MNVTKENCATMEKAVMLSKHSSDNLKWEYYHHYTKL